MWKLIHGKVEDILPTFPDNHFDAVVTDPPYNLSFMGKKWDTIANFQEWVRQWATELLRIMKPGAYLLAFGGTRTYHRLACGIEDAGFVIKDSLHWIYGSGFPKSLDISKAIDKKLGFEREKIRYKARPETSGTFCGSMDTRPWIEEARKKGYYEVANNKPISHEAKQWQGWGTALKPAHEPIVLAQKPVEKNYCHNIEKWGCGGLNIDGCRIPTKEDLGRNNKNKATWGTYGNGPSNQYGKPIEEQGRFPPNLLLDEFAAEMLDEQSGISKSNIRLSEDKDAKQNTRSLNRKGITPRGYNDSGGASRFFPVFKYCAKASRVERTCNGQVENNHPTVKPVKLMQWLCRLVTPPNGLILDPFCGSGSTLVAAIKEGFTVIGIEQDIESIEIAKQRCEITEKESKPVVTQVSLL